MKNKRITAKRVAGAYRIRAGDIPLGEFIQGDDGEWVYAPDCQGAAFTEDDLWYICTMLMKTNVSEGHRAFAEVKLPQGRVPR